jgi:pimeloyl-ACP methyl ester carboxylesterase
MSAHSTNSSTRPVDFDPAAYGPIGRSPWLDVDWREHQRWRSVDGQTINTIELGVEQADDTQTLVFVHGLSGCWANWLEQLPVLADDHRVIALDLPGFGASPMPDGEISIARSARLLDGLLDQLGVDAAALVGNSMGGFIAAELAISFPQRVERLVLVSAAGITTHAHPGAMRVVPAMRRVERIIAMSGAWAASRSDSVARRSRLREVALNVVVRHPGRLPAALAAEQIRGAGKPGFLQGLEATIGYDVRERLPEIACPTLIVWGASDRLIPVADAEVFAELIPDSRKVIYDDTGHMAMLERPAAFNTLLGDFLAE